MVLKIYLNLQSENKRSRGRAVSPEGSGKTFYSTRIIEKKIKGRVAERLGRGLQNLVQRFESARDLTESLALAGFFLWTASRTCSGKLGTIKRPAMRSMTRLSVMIPH